MIKRKKKKVTKRKRRNPEEKQIYLTDEQIKEKTLNYLDKRIRSFRTEDNFDPFMMSILAKIKMEFSNDDMNVDDLMTTADILKFEMFELEKFIENLLPPDAVNENWY